MSYIKYKEVNFINLNEKGASKALWIIAIFFVIVLIVGGLFLIGLSEETKPAEVSVSVGAPVDHAGAGGIHEAAMKVTLEGEKQILYSLALSGPGGSTVGQAMISETEMSDGVHSVYLSMAGMETTPKAGSYTITVTDDSGNTVYDNDFTFSGAQITVEKYGPLEFSETMGDYSLESGEVTVSNEGDLPLYISGLNVTIEGDEVEGMLMNNEPVPPDETKTVEVDLLGAEFYKAGSYEATFEVIQKTTAGEEVAASKTKTVEVG